jgi:hypothetical protein
VVLLAALAAARLLLEAIHNREVRVIHHQHRHLKVIMVVRPTGIVLAQVVEVRVLLVAMVLAHQVLALVAQEPHQVLRVFL